MFVLWLIKRMANWVGEHWDNALLACMFGIPPLEFIFNVAVLGVRQGDTIWMPISVILWWSLTVLAVMGCTIMATLHILEQYRAEQPEKPKRKHKNGTVSMDESCVYFEDDPVGNWDMIMQELARDRKDFMCEHNQKSADRNREFNREMQELCKRKAEDESGE